MIVATYNICFVETLPLVSNQLAIIVQLIALMYITILGLMTDYLHIVIRQKYPYQGISKQCSDALSTVQFNIVVVN